MNCGEMIDPGTKYQRWMSIYKGKGQSEKMHPECLDALEDAHGSERFEYCPYTGDRPKA
jgi:hypothetical protein